MGVLSKNHSITACHTIFIDLLLATLFIKMPESKECIFSAVPDTRFLSPNSIIQGQGCLLYLDRKAIKAAWVKNRERGKFEVFAYPKD